MIAPHPRGAWRPILIVVGGVLLAACSAGGPVGTSTSPKSGGGVTLASWQEPDTLLAAGITDSMTHAFADVNPVMEGLLRGRAAVDVPKNPTIADLSLIHI